SEHPPGAVKVRHDRQGGYGSFAVFAYSVRGIPGESCRSVEGPALGMAGIARGWARWRAPGAAILRPRAAAAGSRRAGVAARHAGLAADSHVGESRAAPLEQQRERAAGCGGVLHLYILAAEANPERHHPARLDRPDVLRRGAMRILERADLEPSARNHGRDAAPRPAQADDRARAACLVHGYLGHQLAIRGGEGPVARRQHPAAGRGLALLPAPVAPLHLPALGVDTPVEPVGEGERVGLIDGEALVHRQVVQHLDNAAWPVNLQRGDLVRPAQPDVGLAPAAGAEAVLVQHVHVAGLLEHAVEGRARDQPGACAVAVAQAANQLHREQRSDIDRVVAPEPVRLDRPGHGQWPTLDSHDVDLVVLVVVDEDHRVAAIRVWRGPRHAGPGIGHVGRLARLDWDAGAAEHAPRAALARLLEHALA